MAALTTHLEKVSGILGRYKDLFPKPINLGIRYVPVANPNNRKDDNTESED